MNDIQFEVITDLAVMNPQHIETNFEAVDAYLTEAMAPYTQLVVTEDSIGDAKKTLAALRKLKDGINSQKIAVKREWMKPYTEYEDKAKQLMSRVEAGISNLDAQLKDYDARRKEEKLAELKGWFDQEVERYRLSDYLTWEAILNPKWANASFSMEDAENAISAAITDTARDVDCINATGSQFILPMLEEYRRTRNLRDALALEKRLADAEARRQAHEAEEAAKAAEAPKDEPAPTLGYETDAQQFIRPIEDVPQTPKTYELSFRVVVTMRQANALKAFFQEQGIKYEKI